MNNTPCELSDLDLEVVASGKKRTLVVINGGGEDFPFFGPVGMGPSFGGWGVGFGPVGFGPVGPRGFWF